MKTKRYFDILSFWRKLRLKLYFRKSNMKKIKFHQLGTFVMLGLCFCIVFISTNYIKKHKSNDETLWTISAHHRKKILKNKDNMIHKVQSKYLQNEFPFDGNSYDTKFSDVKPFQTENVDINDRVQKVIENKTHENLEEAILNTVLKKLKTSKNIVYDQKMKFFQRNTPGNKKMFNSTDMKHHRQTYLYKPETVQECRKRIEASNSFPYWSANNFTNPCWYENKNLQCVPYFFVVGFPKCGTTDIYKRMSLHPGFKAPLFKEIHWITRFRFFPVLQNQNSQPVPGAIKGFDNEFHQYYNVFSPIAQHLKNCTLSSKNSTDVTVIQGVTNKRKCFTQITGDFSPSTIWDADLYRGLPINNNLSVPKYIAADFVYKMNPCAKIIVMLRDPTERLYSDYLHFHKYTTPEDFHRLVVYTIDVYNRCFSQKTVKECVYNDMLESNPHFGKLVRIRQGIYFIYILEWLERFPQDQFLFVKLKDYSADTKRELKRIFTFLEMETFNDEVIDGLAAEKPFNSNRERYGGIDPSPMLPETQSILQAFYRPYNAKLAEVLEDTFYLNW